MVTFPAGMSERERAFMSRQRELRDRLRWLDARSPRARKLQAELNTMMMAELRREITPQHPAQRDDKQPWWLE